MTNRLDAVAFSSFKRDTMSIKLLRSSRKVALSADNLSIVLCFDLGVCEGYWLLDEEAYHVVPFPALTTF